MDNYFGGNVNGRRPGGRRGRGGDQNGAERVIQGNHRNHWRERGIENDNWFNHGAENMQNRQPDRQRRHNFENRQNNDRRRENRNRNQNNERNEDFPPNSERRRTNRTMGFKYVQDLLNEDDISNVIFKLSNDRNGFSKLLDNNDISNDLIILIIQLMRKVCESTFFEVKISLLNTVLQSRFMEKLIFYIVSIRNQSSQDKRKNSFFWNDPDNFWGNLLKISTEVSEIIPTNCEYIQQILSTMKAFFPHIESSHSLHISDDFKASTDSLLEIVELKIKDLEVRREMKRQNNNYDDAEPPDDYREIEIVPSAQEITINKSPFLRPNIVDKAYTSIHQYLDIQFRLLREDFVAPLRRGINTYLRNLNKTREDRKRLDDIKVYSPVRFLNVETVNECNCYRIQFDFSKKKRTFTYENSRRFMFGSLVCFTCDSFQSLLFGKIVQRDPKLLEQGVLIIGFQDQVNISYDADYIMVESTVYFEPYYQVLGVLKRMNTDDFPMEKYIIRVETDTRPPGYLLKDGAQVYYKVENTTFWPLNWPVEKKFYGLNKSQQSAFQAALTREFCIIQGPPGTGKTFLGLKIAHTLLLNKRAWYKKTPILVICFTNHALDQFLEGLLEVTEQVLRVGGQSKNEKLTKFNLARRRYTRNHEAAVHQKRHEVRDCMERIKTFGATLNMIFSNDAIIDFKSFKGVIENYENTWFAKAKTDNIKKWLLEGKGAQYYERRLPVHNPAEVPNGQQGHNNEDVEEDNIEDMDLEEENRNVNWLDDLFDALTLNMKRPLFTLEDMQKRLIELNQELAKTDQSMDDFETMLSREDLQLKIWETETDLEYVSAQLAYYGNPRNRRPPRHINLQNPSKMPPNDRWALYFQWLGQYTQYLRQEYEEANNKFKEVFRVYNELRDMEDTQIMKDHLVVGMTTTGAARLQSSLQALKSPIVIVEEAAEVLEAHIVAALTSSCEHLILIGDHLQLKPGAADYKIERQFKLGISLFERMVNNNIECHTLNVQHRMRPEISSLVKPSIYPALEDHESTLQRPPILGIENSLYFIDHQEKEDVCADASKKNVHEAKFIIALARHLILNGYKPEQITILAAYLGQMFEMLRERNKPLNKMYLQDVRIAVLDNYQGEESDIILLSLVRSNTENKAGFLRIQNRVCVALSRARDGFYIMGNMSLLLNSQSENEIWEKVNKTLENQRAIGPFLTLRCQIHPYQLTRVSKSDDFINISEGGCQLVCHVLIGCGHKCKQLCHVIDRDHNNYKCTENCTRTLCNDSRHVCQKLCYQECGPCTYLVARYLDCGHRVEISCHIDINTYKCPTLVHTKLPCEHEAEKPCHMNPNDFQCPHPCDTRVEPCGHSCERKCHIRADPDHLKYKCKQACARPRIGCKEIENPHICNRFCFLDCEECNIGVNKERSCGHFYTIPCKQDIEDVECKRPCKKMLSCGHPCKSKCFEECGPCAVMVEKVIPICNHTIKIKCSETPTRQHCKSGTCPRLLPCGHKCTKPCKENCTEKCTKIVNCNIKTPCGHKLTKIECHLKDTDNADVLLKRCTEPCSVELKCKHKCSGTCGECMQSRIHKRCTEKCGIPLVCNHECPIPCRQACQPCTKKCELKCSHSKCKKNCGETCTSCKEACRRRCQHLKCTKLCGEICNTPPCNERCPKLLKCGHPCVGFCNDPCPVLCRICNNEELTEIFLGNEDEPEAIYVMLEDCKHIFEHSDLDNWFKQDAHEIKFKVCPRCKTTVTTTQRYSDDIKRTVNDIVSVKEQLYGTIEANETLRRKLKEDIDELKANTNPNVISACPELIKVFKALNARLLPAKNQRRQPISKIELNAIDSKIQTLNYIINCFKAGQGKTEYSENDQPILYLNILLSVLLRSEDQVSNQEIEDLELEIKRLNRIVQYDQIKKSVYYEMAKSHPNITTVKEDVEALLYTKKRYNNDMDSALKELLQMFSQRVDSTIQISDAERVQIVKAIGLAQGHWYKCPNGHPYAIANCGGANQVSRCFCGEQIGGTDHHLLPTNQHAPEMDGSTRHAWPGGLY